MDMYDDEPKAKFNAGLAKLERISELRKGIHDARITNQWDKWNACLEGIRSEINAKLKKEQRLECDMMEQRILSSRKTYNDAKRKKLPSLVNPRNCLYNYELYIGELEEKTGMGMPEMEDDGL